MKQFADDWERKGSARLEVWMRGTLLKKFVKAQGNYLPAAVEELRNFVDIYAGPFDTPFPREKLARVLEVISGDRTVGLSKTNLQRAIASLVVIVSYLIEQFARADNHLAAAEGWVMTAANILRIAERECLSPSAYVPSLNLVRDAFERSLDSLADETLGAEHFVLSRGGLADPMLYGVRATQVLGWLCYWVIDRRWRKGHSVNIRTVLNVIRREGAAMSWVGEADWPLRMCLAFFLDREGYASDAERLLQGWASSITAASRPPARPGVPSPYWPQEKVLRLRYGLLPPTEQEHFGHYVYTLEQCLDMLVRRLRRQSVASLWPDASRLILCNFVPGSHSAYFTWNDDSGTLHTVSPVRTARWQDWRQRTAVVDVSKVPITLVRHSEWALPFLIVYPHRANVVMSAFVDALNTGRAAVHAPNETEAPVSAGRKRKPLQESSVAPK
ncbi:MAG TPA: hypothetical protein VJV22_15665 [Acidobacteriaceae bacterium]|nr:hypothetical protein [Acidobacteriaceae bacterium]